MGKYIPGQSKEDYLETILMIQRRLGKCYSADVVSHLGFSKASVSVAMKKLVQEGLIEKEPDGQLLLTEAGNDIATHVLNRHYFLTDCFTALGVTKDTAEQDACLIEHVISEESIEKLHEWHDRLLNEQQKTE